MNDETDKIVSSLDCRALDALEVSGVYWRRIPTWKSYTNVFFPEFDLCHDVVPNRKFDIIFAEQVLEHVKYPYRAVRNIHKMLNSNGRFVATTPFLIQVHGSPEDYTRWTEEGLKYLLEDCGFDASKVTTASWGNRECAIADMNSCAEGNGWLEYIPDEHSLINEPLYPVVVWAIAQKD